MMSKFEVPIILFTKIKIIFGKKSISPPTYGGGLHNLLTYETVSPSELSKIGKITPLKQFRKIIINYKKIIK